jgi:hypothetical protein
MRFHLQNTPSVFIRFAYTHSPAHVCHLAQTAGRDGFNPHLYVNQNFVGSRYGWLEVYDEKGNIARINGEPKELAHFVEEMIVLRRKAQDLKYSKVFGYLEYNHGKSRYEYKPVAEEQPTTPVN